MPTLSQLRAAVNPDRIAESAMSLLTIPSPTGKTAKATSAYGDLLGEAGCKVEFYHDNPEAPGMAATYSSGTGPTLQLDGHIDVVPVPHDPPRLEDGILYGRGAADMKGSLAVCAEVMRVISESGLALPGSLLLSTHGQHEAPGGHGEGLRAMIGRGVVGDAAVVMEGPYDYLALAGRGMAIYTITITRDGEVTHENETQPETPHPLIAAARLVVALESYGREVNQVTRPVVGRETLFVGQIHGGDFYNRYPTSAMVQGTRRYVFDHPFDEVEKDMAAICQKISNETGMRVALDLDKIRDGFAVAEDERIVESLRNTHKEMTGETMPLGAFPSVADVSLFVGNGGIPAIYVGCDGENLHGDNEHVRLESLATQCHKLLGTVWHYFGL